MTGHSPLRAALFLVLLLGACGGERSDQRSASTPAAAEPPAVPTAEAPSAQPANAVQHEMRMLLQALQGAVAAIADNDLARIPSLITGIHEARDATEAAIESGSYRPPKNADRLAAFQAMDEAFHEELVRLVKAARANDLAATSAELGRVLGQCQGCHTMFRDLE